MPKYFVECHQDGDFTPTWEGVVEAPDQVLAKREAMLAMMIEQGQFEVCWNDGETDIVGYETIDGYVDSKSEAMVEAEAYAYVDSITPIDPYAPTTNPSVALIEAVGELLFNRDHLDLHPDDRRMLEAGLRMNKTWLASRELHA